MSCVDTYVPATCKRNGLTLCSLLHFMSQLANGATQTHRFQLIHSTYAYLLLFTPVRPCLSQPSCLSQLISSSNEKYHSIFAVINFNLDEIDFNALMLLTTTKSQAIKHLERQTRNHVSFPNT